MVFRKNSRIHRDPENFRRIVAGSLSIREVRRKLGYKESGGFYVLFRQACIRYSIDTSHFTGSAWNRGLTKENDERMANSSLPVKSWDDAFSYNSTISNGSLLRRLINEKKKEYKCEICGISEWNDRPIRLQLDHKNGDRLDSREENLRIICPNCHSQTDTFSRGQRTKCIQWWERTKNHKGAHRPIGRSRNFEKVECGGSNPPELIRESWRKKERPHKRKVARPSKEELAHMISVNSWTSIGKIFGVSDNAVRKWAKRYGILTSK